MSFNRTYPPPTLWLLWGNAFHILVSEPTFQLPEGTSWLQHAYVHVYVIHKKDFQIFPGNTGKGF